MALHRVRYDQNSGGWGEVMKLGNLLTRLGQRLLLWGMICCLATQAAAQQPPTPKLLVLRGEQLEQLRRAHDGGNPQLSAWVAEITAEADTALSQEPLSVIHKPEMPPSGDKRDYMSVGPYWWPDPNKPDGLPYIRRDGEVHPDRRKDDSATKGRMTAAVTRLAYGYYFTGDERYAQHAAKLLRTWFLDEQTRMNPHLRYGQAIPGRNQGRYIGIIDTVSFINLLDAVLLIAESPHWTAEDHAGLQQWFADYLAWLTTSEFGKQERAHPNNHGTWFDAQVVAFAKFAGNDQLAQATLQDVGRLRIAKLIMPDGSQPEELSRTKALGYSVYNLLALVTLARLAEGTHEDLWGFRTAEGSSIRQALDWLSPYVSESEPFPYQQIGKMNWTGIARLYRMAGYGYDSQPYHAMADAALMQYTGTPAADLLRAPD